MNKEMNPALAPIMGGTQAPRPQMMGQPLGGGIPLNSQILSNWVTNNPAPTQQPVNQAMRQRLAGLFMTGGRGAMGGDVGARGNYSNPRLPSESMLRGMENMPGWNIPGLIARGLAKMGRNAQNKGRDLGFGGSYGRSGSEGYSGGGRMGDLSRDPTPGTAGR